jgi:hypothetical protein
MSWPNLRCTVDWNRCERMLLWPNLKCYFDWKWCDRKLSRPVWTTMWIKTDDWRWSFDLIWGDIWIGTDVKGAVLKKLKLLRGLESIL